MEKMTPKTTEYYDWHEQLEPVILANLNEILVSKGIDPLDDLHGGNFKDGKWVGVLESEDYRNYWHVYLELWGERIRNDVYDIAYFPYSDDDPGWSYFYEGAVKSCEHRNKLGHHSDPEWANDLVDAVRKMCRDHDLYERVLIWWSW